MQTYLAPAKLNLFLHITSRRPDGYHNLQTIFQFLDYCDVLHFTHRNDGQIVLHDKADIPLEENLIFKAARLLQQHTKTHLGIDITLEKNIPMGGGLGGGISDAATTLFALNQLWQLNLDTEILMQLGLQLGADVPIFLYGKAAWAEGIGEKLTPIDLDEPYYLVIHPNCHVSTREIFSTKSLTRNMPLVNMSHFLAGQCKNVFEPVVCQHTPEVQTALNWLNQYGSARMTGSGACIFAQFADKTQAQKLLTKLPPKWNGFVAEGKNYSPLFDH